MKNMILNDSESCITFSMKENRQSPMEFSQIPVNYLPPACFYFQTTGRITSLSAIIQTEERWELLMLWSMPLSKITQGKIYRWISRVPISAISLCSTVVLEQLTRNTLPFGWTTSHGTSSGQRNNFWFLNVTLFNDPFGNEQIDWSCDLNIGLLSFCQRYA